jgi:soluble lytic murein transglycosylase-like protein
MRLPWRSPKGVRGWMPLIPETVERFDVTAPGDLAHNIAGDTRYLPGLLDRFDGHVTLARAGYNAGEGVVKR